MVRAAKKKKRIVVDNHLKGSFGETEITTGKPTVIKINVKKHKGDRAELADTIKHELMHAKHPKMHEKTVYKKMRVPMSQTEQDAMVAKLRHKTLNMKVGAIKRKLKIHHKTQPGELIEAAKDVTTYKQTMPTNETAKVSMMGLI